MDSTIKPTIAHLKRATVPVHSGCNHFPIGSFNSGIDVSRSGRNIDNLTGMNLQGPIVTTIPYYNRANKCNMLDSVIRTSDLAYRVSPRRGIIKIESENVVENLGGKKNSKMLSAKK